MESWWVCDDGRRMVIVPVHFDPFWVPMVHEVIDTTFDLERELRRHASTSPTSDAEGLSAVEGQ
jgi:hypothetical protein